MGFGDIVNKVKNLARKKPDAVDKAVDTVGDKADDLTGHKAEGLVDKAQDAAKKAVRED